MFKEAKHIYRWFLSKFGYVAIVNPFSKTCHVLKGFYPPNYRLRKHELKHIEQIENEGAIKFTLKYLYYNIRLGYNLNPYEIEANKAENS